MTAAAPVVEVEPAVADDPGIAAATAEGVEIFGGASGPGEAAGVSTGVGREDEEALFELVEEARVDTGRAEATPFRIGVDTLVDREIMSFPCTTS